jgi:tRNA pseudouridine38-40 synthase
VPSLLEARDRSNVPFTAAADGLYLEHIYLSEQSLIQDFGEDIKIHRKKSLQND